ncbi:hypothetical protein PGTUg99_034105 [Puccinia graminis f. sp. tritici]|uniref:Uncharacterized protein n=1 Tax=Puccinia graminis f. sp. tritici TaxID=56615 RepID=A0A5B0RUY5_PUCGR|nr:hypothetical protein PGTUg99_034105 [Puccinia graminis f. sp. tritici]
MAEDGCPDTRQLVACNRLDQRERMTTHWVNTPGCLSGPHATETFQTTSHNDMNPEACPKFHSSSSAHRCC